MRKVILGVGISLDGFIARENGDVDFLVMDKEYAKKEQGKFFASIDAAIMGRKTFDKAREMGGNPANFKGMTCYVFSHTPQESEIENLKFVSGDVKEFVENLKQQGGKDIWMMGGGELSQTFLEHGLIDEIALGITPVIIGSGLPLFLPLNKQINLKLTEAASYPSGMVKLVYEVKKNN